MTEEAAAVIVVPARVRAARALRERDHWLQLLRFGLVGASGYVVNLAVFALATHGLGVDYRLAAAVAFLVAVSNNFTWNRRWTFDARGGHAGRQAARFLIISVAAFLVGLGLLQLLVEWVGVPKLPAQAGSILAVMPLSFLGNRLWSFSA
jgi:putative flippase GtrA